MIFPYPTLKLENQGLSFVKLLPPCPSLNLPIFNFTSGKNFLHLTLIFYLSASAVDDLQMKELQDQLEAETYFSVYICIS